MRITTLRQPIDTPGSSTSVHLDDSHDTEDAETQLAPNLRDLRHESSARPAPEGPGPVGRGVRGARTVVAGRDTAVEDDEGEPSEASWSAGCIRT
jgi:hypothetical protein